MSQYSRQIETKTNLVFFDPEDEHRSVNIDCSELAAENIAFVCEEDGVMWVEYKTFDGRHYDIDVERMESYFQLAATSWNEQNDLEMSGIDVTPTIDAVSGFFALHQIGFSEAYETWVSSGERTFLQKAYFNHSTLWRKDDEILITCLSDIGMTEQQIEDLFEIAASYNI